MLIGQSILRVPAVSYLPADTFEGLHCVLLKYGVTDSTLTGQFWRLQRHAWMIEDDVCCGIRQMLHCCALSALWYLLQTSVLSTAPLGDSNRNRQVLIQLHRPFVSSLLRMMSAKTPFQVVSLLPEENFANAVNV